MWPSYMVKPVPPVDCDDAGYPVSDSFGRGTAVPRWLAKYSRVGKIAQELAVQADREAARAAAAQRWVAELVR